MGAGLPAMQTTRCISDTPVMLSQASQLPHKPLVADGEDAGLVRPDKHIEIAHFVLFQLCLLGQ